MNIEWSNTARRYYFNTAGYIKEEWGLKAVKAFRKDVNDAIKTIKSNPSAFPLSQKLDSRKCVINKHNILIYNVQNNTIYIEDFVNANTNHPY